MAMGKFCELHFEESESGHHASSGKSAQRWGASRGEGTIARLAAEKWKVRDSLRTCLSLSLSVWTKTTAFQIWIVPSGGTVVEKLRQPSTRGGPPRYKSSRKLYFANVSLDGFRFLDENVKRLILSALQRKRSRRWPILRPRRAVSPSSHCPPPPPPRPSRLVSSRRSLPIYDVPRCPLRALLPNTAELRLSKCWSAG